MSFSGVFIVLVLTCTWTNLRLVRGPARLHKPVWHVQSLGRPMVTDVYTPPMKPAQLVLPIGKPIPVRFAPSRVKRLTVEVKRADWQQFIVIKA